MHTLQSFCVDVVLILGHLAGGIVVSVYASEWGDFSGVSNMVERVQAALISAAVSCSSTDSIITQCTIIIHIYVYTADVTLSHLLQAIRYVHGL